MRVGRQIRRSQRRRPTHDNRLRPIHYTVHWRLDECAASHRADIADRLGCHSRPQTSAGSRNPNRVQNQRGVGMMSPTVIPDEVTLRRTLESAVRAPSVYNSQPWRWRISTADGVDLFADPDRHLMAIDLDGRDLLLSCGAALPTGKHRGAGPGDPAAAHRPPSLQRRTRRRGPAHDPDCRPPRGGAPTTLFWSGDAATTRSAAGGAAEPAPSQR